MSKLIHLRIRRQQDPSSQDYWENFTIPYDSSMNIIACLMEIQKNPRNADGETTTPVVWEDSCLEEVCGSCTMLINGKARQACSALVDELEQPISLEPMSKFRTIRDLCVDRSSLLENLKKVKAWIPFDGSQTDGKPVRISPETRKELYDFSCCMMCGVCLEVCPQVNEKTSFFGAATLSQAFLFNQHPVGSFLGKDRMETLMSTGGLADCGNAQMCVEYCPKNIPLTRSIAQLQREATRSLFTDWLKK